MLELTTIVTGRQQLSNRHIPGKREQLIFAGIGIAAATGLYLIENADRNFSLLKFILASLIMLFFLSVWYFFSYARYYHVEADKGFVYFSRFRATEKIDLGRITSIRHEPMKLPFLYRGCCRVIICYHDKKRKERHIRFLSAEKGQADASGLQSVQLLKQLIRDRK